MIGNEQELDDADNISHTSVLLPKRVVQIGLAALQIEVHASGEVVLQAQQNTIRNGRHDEVEPEYNDRNVMRDLVH